jgi:hypothetical protein
MALERCLWQARIVKTLPLPTRGYFAIGVEGISKAVNLGNLFALGPRLRRELRVYDRGGRKGAANAG